VQDEKIYVEASNAKLASLGIDPSLIAATTGITTVADFRRADVARGGYVLADAAHPQAVVFASDWEARAVVNIGGIANLTALPGADEGQVRGFDTGPGNVLLDLWHMRHHDGPAFDADGAWAASGNVDAPLLDALLAERYFALAPPKSTGRDLFNAAWLDGALAARGAAIAPADVQATLLALTTRTIARAIGEHAPAASEVLVCGGGAHNRALMRSLSDALAPRAVAPTSSEGVAVNHVEALAFAWLARAALAGEPGNRPEVTGAKGLRVLGAIYPR